jgi:hypothetical protein
VACITVTNAKLPDSVRVTGANADEVSRRFLERVAKMTWGRVRPPLSEAKGLTPRFRLCVLVSPRCVPSQALRGAEREQP